MTGWDYAKMFSGSGKVQYVHNSLVPPSKIKLSMCSLSFVNFTLQEKENY